MILFSSSRGYDRKKACQKPPHIVGKYNHCTYQQYTQVICICQAFYLSPNPLKTRRFKGGTAFSTRNTALFIARDSGFSRDADCSRAFFELSTAAKPYWSIST